MAIQEKPVARKGDQLCSGWTVPLSLPDEVASIYFTLFLMLQEIVVFRCLSFSVDNTTIYIRLSPSPYTVDPIF
jgi:hypothetical protein